MQEGHYNRLVLNLLAIFDTIMSERSLTKAGKRLGMTQSAVSHALARLREVTGDLRWSRLFGQFFRLDKWIVCRG